jgi:hypothetical protein
VGDAFAGTANMNIIDAPLGASEAIKNEMLLNLKNVSALTAVPIHWMAWPELMSNRATAENLLEVVNAGTKKERLIWEEKFQDIIEKSMVLAVENNLEDPNIIGDFTVKLDIISVANLKQIQETWMPLQEAGVIAMNTLRSKVPTVNPTEEEKLVNQEADDNFERNKNNLLNSNEMKDENEDTGEDTKE